MRCTKCDTCVHPKCLPCGVQQKKWLMAALESMTVDETKRMSELAGVLSRSVPEREAPDDEEPDEDTKARLSALDELQDLVEGLDNAKNLFIIGGFDPLLRSLSHPHIRVRTRACEVLNTVVQNNPKPQAWALRSGCGTALVRVLLSCLDSSLVPLPSATRLQCASAAIGALSSCVRTHTDGQRFLLRPMDLPQGGSATPLDLILAPVRAWMAAPAGDRDARLRRVVRKCVVTLTAAASDILADRVKTACLRPAPGVLPVLLPLLVPPASLAADDADDRLIRQYALSALTHMCGETEAVVEVVDDTEHRVPAGFKTAAGAKHDAPSEAATAAPAAALMLTDSASTSAAAHTATASASASASAETTGAAAPSLVVMSHAQRLATMRNPDFGVTAAAERLRDALTEALRQPVDEAVVDKALYEEELQSVTALLKQLQA